MKHEEKLPEWVEAEIEARLIPGDRYVFGETAGLQEGARIVLARVQPLLEALEKTKEWYWNRCYVDSGHMSALSVDEFDRRVDKALTQWHASGDKKDET